MTGRADLPVIARPDAEVSTFSEWTTVKRYLEHRSLSTAATTS